MRVTPKATRFSHRFEETDLEKIREFKLDVLFRAGFGILRGGILTAAKYGVWSYHNGDNRANRGGPAGFWEVFENWPATGSILQILSEDLDNGTILYESHSATVPNVRQNQNGFFWKSLSFFPRRLKELHAVGEEKFFERVKELNQHKRFYSNRLYVIPTNSKLAVPLAKHIARRIKSKIVGRCFFDQWFLMYDFREGMSTSFWRFKKLVPPKDRFWADPHVVYRDGKYHIFFEEYPYAARKGHISLITMDSKGNHTEPVKVLERPYHLSYPFVFEWEGNHYMIPESCANRSIEVYKCTRFPDQWEFHKTLMTDILAADATLFHHANTWWLFAAVMENEQSMLASDELFLYYADNPLSDRWTAHPRNPVVSDARKARPAGNLFESNGNLYRPSQNCTGRYGYGMKINHILRLDKTEYREKEVDSVEPHWEKSTIGVHTINHAHRLTMIDGLQKRWRVR